MNDVGLHWFLVAVFAALCGGAIGTTIGLLSDAEWGCLAGTFVFLLVMSLLLDLERSDD